MSDRVKDDPSLASAVAGEATPIHNPLVIIHKVGEKQQFLLHLDNLDPWMTEPRLWGIMVSDLVDHIAAAYASRTRRDAKDLRDEIMRTAQREMKFKDRDPSRGDMRGTTVMPRKN